MRAIKFRGITPDGELVFGDLVYSYSQSILFITHGDGWAPSYNNPDKGEENIYHAIIPETVGQFTGLKDKNGVEIYEGDIVDLHPAIGDKIWHRIIDWDTGAFHVRQIHGKANFPIHFTKYEKDDRDWVVIGNIHQNPELLTS